MYKESGCLWGQTQRFPWDAEVREAESPLLGGDRLHCRVSVFKNKNRTGNSASDGWLVFPNPHSYSKVFPFSSKHMQSSSGQYPVFEKGGRINRKNKTKQNPKFQRYTASTHPGRER